MSILTIGSTNPDFSHIIAKNPATIRDTNKAYRRELRKGVCYGWFTTESNQDFRLWFKDHETRSSFADGFSEEFEYLDKSRYGSPYLPIAMVTTCLASAAKELHELDTPKYSSYIEVNIKVPRGRYLEQLCTHYASLANISYTYISGSYYALRIESPTIFLLLNVLQVVCILQCLCDKETYVKLDTATVEKFVKIFNKACSPYFPRYLFQKEAVSNQEMFEKLKNDLSGPGINLVFGDTRQQRFDAIKPYLTGGTTLIDIGCGEMFYSLKLLPKYDFILAVDADEEVSFNNAGKIKGRGISNIQALHKTITAEWVEEEDFKFNGTDVLLTEVLEHLEYEEAESLLSSVLKTEFNKVVVTCPNKDFNINYGLSDDEFRHPDHKWEPSMVEFCDQMSTLAAASGCTVYCSGIGDCVDDVNTSLMAVFVKESKS